MNRCLFFSLSQTKCIFKEKLDLLNSNLFVYLTEQRLAQIKTTDFFKIKTFYAV